MVGIEATVRTTAMANSQPLISICISTRQFLPMSLLIAQRLYHHFIEQSNLASFWVCQYQSTRDGSGRVGRGTPLRQSWTLDAFKAHDGLHPSPHCQSAKFHSQPSPLPKMPSMISSLRLPLPAFIILLTFYLGLDYAGFCKSVTFPYVAKAGNPSGYNPTMA